MKITDKVALAELKKVKSNELYETIKDYPDDERDGRSDLQFLADEVSYQISCFNEDGHNWNEDLTEAKEILKETKNGKVIPYYPNLQPKYRSWQIDNAKALISEYRRLLNCLKRLNSKGYYGRWWNG